MGELGGNQLIYSNKTAKDIILKDEFEKMLGPNFINTLTRENSDVYDNRRIDKAFLTEIITNFKQPFYVCGPDLFVNEIHDILIGLGADAETVVIEK